MESMYESIYNLLPSPVDDPPKAARYKSKVRTAGALELLFVFGGPGSGGMCLLKAWVKRGRGRAVAKWLVGGSGLELWKAVYDWGVQCSGHGN